MAGKGLALREPKGQGLKEPKFMQSETKTCQNCKQDFIIESEDFNFYEKIKVPAPTLCPECSNATRFNEMKEICIIGNVVM